ncbi:helical backbone metal receptor [Rhabdobacter roseus]|uniref:ABC-type Fe3+-hydroxamate transport system substrate-binding protein n=1 Tax=Rhabdobacter roseus TaxID=1655419 RepID=A0A840U1H5_9BACT|nr:helical backbone metal receptor [Rhabdobacter roseus]MBB5285980.1 ABC-type Fe3+-hydroxamate transport system substrate-binding protein [Rhabdobacter roseus]
MQTFTDQTGHDIYLEVPPQRVVSLVPSQTELLFDLGLNAEVVGLTKYCRYPESKVRHKAVVGGTKDVDLALVRALAPDLIIGNKEENTQEAIEQLRRDFPVWTSDVRDLPAAGQMMRALGTLVDKEASAHWIASKIEERFAELASEQISQLQRRRVAYLIWRKPWMVAAADTFIHHLLEKAGFTNAFAQQQRYPTCTAEELRQAQPEVVFLSSEPYPFKEKHLTELRQICPHASVKLVDGELFSWYGSRLLRTPSYLRHLRSSL